MNILYLCYWGVQDGLTKATVFPHLKILSEQREVAKIIFCTIERDKSFEDTTTFPTKVLHDPLRTGTRYFDKLLDFTKFPVQLINKVKEHRIDFIISRGSPAGALAHLVHTKTATLYAVESFEPHAAYMLESNVWRRWGLKYIFQRYWEKQQYKTARWLLPVAEGYRRKLIELNVPVDKIIVLPCAVDFAEFNWSETKRLESRKELGIDNDVVVGIYVGKFGGLYYDDEAFVFFKEAKNYFTKFKLIVLSPDNTITITNKLKLNGFLEDEFLVTSVAHGAVSGYLSAADIAFTFYKPSPSKLFLSPVKVGEYWACGLPVLIADGIGDDSAIIKQRKVGAIFTLTFENMRESLQAIHDLLKEPDYAVRFRAMATAHEFRSMDKARTAYRKMIESMKA